MLRTRDIAQYKRYKVTNIAREEMECKETGRMERLDFGCWLDWQQSQKYSYIQRYSL